MMKFSGISYVLAALLWVGAMAAQADEIHLAQGVMSGEVTATGALIQTRLTATEGLDDSGDVPGTTGVVAFEWGKKEDFSDAAMTTFEKAVAERDFIVRAELTGLEPGTKYFYRPVYGAAEEEAGHGPTASFKTHPGADSNDEVSFIVGSCMNYMKFMHGKPAKASGPVTATEEDKRLGFPSFAAMKEKQPDFFIGTGDIVYYDNPMRVAETLEELRKCWHEQFRFPRMVAFFEDVPTYWSKDDHDFRYNDSDNEGDRLPLPKTGIDMFKEQLPIAPSGAEEVPTYRTYRVSRDLQIWLSEGRDYRSPNKMKDGPDKTLWGVEQKAWLKRTLKESDAKWKILITPTPMVGPDDGYKTDNHANLKGFRHEAAEFFNWLNENEIENFFTICGDRHWQYHSIHPKGLNEFAVGAIDDENSRLGRKPGDPRSTDPKGRIDQRFISPKPTGGFLQVTAGEKLVVEFFDDEGNSLHRVVR